LAEEVGGLTGLGHHKTLRNQWLVN